MIPIVMCIDDDTMVQMLSKLIFDETAFCHLVIPALHGAEALDYFENQAAISAAKRQWPDLIFLDINMPVLDGWGFLDAYTAQFAALHPSTKIFMLSSSVDPADREISLQYDLVVDFVPKPLSKKFIAELKLHVELKHFFL